MEDLEVVHLFSRAHELDGGAGDLLHGEGCAAAGVAVHLGEDDAGEAEALVEGLGHVYGLLPEGGVGYEENLVWLDLGLEALEFADECVVDLEAARGVEEDEVGAELLGLFPAVAGDAGNVLGGAVGVAGEVFLLGEGLQLVDGGGSVDVAGDEHGLAPVLGEALGELGGGGGLARAVEADEEDAQRAILAQVGGALAEELDEFVVDDLDDLLAGGD